MILTFCGYYLIIFIFNFLYLRAIMLNLILMSLLTYIPILTSIAFVILGERKLLAAIQRREGPNLVGWFGLLQSFVDGFKLILKENILPHKSNKLLFFISAFNIFLISLIA